MAANHSSSSSRRGFLKSAAAGTGLGLGALLAGCDSGTKNGAATGRKPLKALFSSAGLTGTWNKLGKDAAELWGKLLDVEVHWIDGEFNGQTQRNKIDMAVDDDWDFFAVQAHQIGILEEPVKRLKERNVPVISMDTLIAEKPRLREVGAWLYIAPDHVAMARQSTQHLMDKIGGRGNVIHIGGQSGHSGAQDRKRGFEEVVAKYPDVKVVGGEVRWCDWKPELARNTFESLLELADGPVVGAFCHNDDMALACVPAVKKTEHEDAVFASVDGQKDGLTGVRDGQLAATSLNPTCLIHGWSLVIGQFIVRNGEKIDDVPQEIILPSPLVSRDAGNIDAMFYLADPAHCLM